MAAEVLRCSRYITPFTSWATGAIDSPERVIFLSFPSQISLMCMKHVNSCSTRTPAVRMPLGMAIAQSVCRIFSTFWSKAFVTPSQWHEIGAQIRVCPEKQH
uniref:Uncharacterized protein n=1 Tax=Eutreptiella gymnastica TaxID=73025 RepID=A0A7S1N0N6_9EUGL